MSTSVSPASTAEMAIPILFVIILKALTIVYVLMDLKGIVHTAKVQSYFYDSSVSL